MPARYLAKKMRAQFPQLKILVGFWDGKKSSEAARHNLETAKPDWIVNTPAEAIWQVCPVTYCQPYAALESVAGEPAEKTFPNNAGPASPETDESVGKTPPVVDAGG